MELDTGDFRRAIRRYATACPDDVGRRGSDALSASAKASDFLGDLGAKIDRENARFLEELEAIQSDVGPVWRGHPEDDPFIVFGDGVPQSPPPPRFPSDPPLPHPDRKPMNPPPESIPLRSFDPQESQEPDEQFLELRKRWLPAEKALPELRSAVLALDRQIDLEVRTAETLKTGKEALQKLKALQSKPRLDHASIAAKIAKADETMRRCESIRQDAESCLRRCDAISGFGWSGPLRGIQDTIESYGKSNSDSGFVARMKDRVQGLSKRFSANEERARESRRSYQAVIADAERIAKRKSDEIAGLRQSAEADVGLGKTTEAEGRRIVDVLRKLEDELHRDAPAQPSIVQYAKHGETWNISIEKESETTHLRVVRRMEAASRCKALLRSIEKVLPPLEDLSPDDLNPTSAFPGFVACGETTWMHSRPGVEIVLPEALAFPWEAPVTVPRSAIAPIMLRIAWSMPLGRISFTALDHESMGESIRPLNGLSDVPGVLHTVTSVDAIADELTTLQECIAERTGSAFKGDVSNWSEYNAKRPRSPLSCKFLVVFSLAGFERGYGLAEALSGVLRNGPRCGVFAIVAKEALDALDKREAEKLSGVLFRSAGDDGSADDAPRMLRLKKDFAFPELPDDVAAKCEAFAEATKKALDKPAKGFAELFAGEGFWSGDASKGFDALIGWDDRDQPIRFRLGDRIPHALLGGATGSGKSNLIHVLIHALCHKYSPEELNLYMLDYKDGLEFQKYTEGGKAWLPHARTVSTANDPAYALTMFSYLKEEQRRRKKTFGGCSNYIEYRNSGKKMPRIVVIVDEFHKMFEGSTADAVSDGLNDIFKQGRAFGIHLVLATQTLRGLNFAGKSGMLGQIGLRFALHSNSGDDEILMPDNTAALNIKIPQCILNEEGGNKKANIVFKLPYADHKGAEGLAFRKRCEDGAKAARMTLDCRVFDGTRLPALPSAAAMQGLMRNAPPSYDSHLLLGVRNDFLGTPFFASFDDEPGGNLMICGENGDLDEAGNVTGLDVWKGLRSAIWRSLEVQSGTAFLHYDPLAREKPGRIPANGTFLGAEVRDDATLLPALEKLFGKTASQKFVIVENYGRARLLHPESTPASVFGRRDSEPPKPTARALFLSAFSGSTDAPFHVVLMLHNFENTRRTVLEKNRETNILAGCAKRIAFNLSKSDMERFMPRTLRMDSKNRVLFCDETQPDDPVPVLAFAAP